jgi:hypothetical protein
MPDAGTLDAAPDPTKVILNANTFPSAQAASINITQGATIGTTLTCGSSIGIGTVTPKSGLQVSSSVQATPIVTDDNSVVLDGKDPAGNARIELRSSPGAGVVGTPYIDFARDTTSDFNARIMLTSNTTLSVQGSNLAVPGLIVQGAASVGYAHYSCTPTTGVADCQCPSPNEVVISGGAWINAGGGRSLRESRMWDTRTWRVTCTQTNPSNAFDSLDTPCSEIDIICARLAN